MTNEYKPFLDILVPLNVNDLKPFDISKMKILTAEDFNAKPLDFSDIQPFNIDDLKPFDTSDLKTLNIRNWITED